MRGYGLIIAVGILLLSSQAQALTGGDLADFCRYADQNSSTKGAMCTGYVLGTLNGRHVGYLTGVATAYTTAAIKEGGGSEDGKALADKLNELAEADELLAGYCLSDRVTTTQAVAVLKKWLDEHPERHHENGAILVMEALQDAFGTPNTFGEKPCN